MKWVACTRMYDVTPEVRAHWHALMRRVAHIAGVAIDCIDHAVPKPLTELWARDDLGAAFMCGLALATRYPTVRPLTAPVTVLAEADAPTYRSVWLVRADSRFDTLASTFGHRIGWLVDHSHSGFNAPRHALLAHRSPSQPKLYRESVGPLGHPRRALRTLAARGVDVLAVDAWWWWLLQRYDAHTAAGFRTIGETAPAPIPPLVCAARCEGEVQARLSAALVSAHEDAEAGRQLSALGVRHFANVTRRDYDVLADMDRAACGAGYPLPH